METRLAGSSECSLEGALEDAHFERRITFSPEQPEEIAYVSPARRYCAIAATVLLSTMIAAATFAAAEYYSEDRASPLSYQELLLSSPVPSTYAIVRFMGGP